jgi:hypothetical protein
MRDFPPLPPVLLDEEEADVNGFAVCPVVGFFVSGVLAALDSCFCGPDVFSFAMALALSGIC